MNSRLLLFGLIASIALAQTATVPVSTARLDDHVQAYVDSEDFSGSVLVVKDGQTLLDKGYGLANAEWDIPNTPDTKFRLGSLTKSFTAMCVLLLEQQGKWKVSDPITKYLPDAPAAWQPITIHHLLTHTSGLPNFTGFPDHRATMMQPSPPEKTILRFRDKPLEFEPGTKFNYSNSGYVLLGLLIEKISGQKFEDYLQQQVLDPLGMKNTGYDHPETVLKHRAAGYVRGIVLKNTAFIDMTGIHGAGALYSTTGDLRLWDEALTAGKLLQADAMKRYLTPFKNSYAYGWAVKEKKGVTVISHGGNINGFTSMFMRIPAEKLLVVTLANINSFGAPTLANELAQLARGVDVPKPIKRTAISLTASQLEPFVGEYALTPNLIFTITREGDQLFCQATGEVQHQIFPESAKKFFYKAVSAQLSFEQNASGQVTSLTLHLDGYDRPAKKIK